jgi:hypothetical protein
VRGAPAAPGSRPSPCRCRCCSGLGRAPRRRVGGHGGRGERRRVEGQSHPSLRRLAACRCPCPCHCCCPCPPCHCSCLGVRGLHRRPGVRPGRAQVRADRQQHQRRRAQPEERRSAQAAAQLRAGLRQSRRRQQQPRSRARWRSPPRCYCACASVAPPEGCLRAGRPLPSLRPQPCAGRSGRGCSRGHTSNRHRWCRLRWCCRRCRSAH